MVTSQPPSPPPAGPPDQDHRPSIMIGMAASMLRHRHHPLDVANATDVPLALVELIATEHHSDSPGHPGPTRPTGATSSMVDEHHLAIDDDPVRPGLSVQHPEPVASRWRVWICCAAVLVIAGNVSLAAAAEIMRMSTLAVVAVILTPLLLTALGLCAIGCACLDRDESPRPH